MAEGGLEDVPFLSLYSLKGPFSGVEPAALGPERMECVIGRMA